MKSIVWLASYPKSGNTWMRVFLANYILNQDKPVSINEMDFLRQGDARNLLYEHVAGGPVDFSNHIETLKLRPKALKAVVANNADVNFLKTHVANTTVQNVRLIPPELTRCAIYIVRNPLDMVASYSNHYNLTIDRAIEVMASYRNSLGSSTSKNGAFQYLGPWFEHSLSWAKETEFPVLIVRYEDMLEKPFDSFSKIIKHIGLENSFERINRAIQFSSFKELKIQEKENGFSEKLDHTERFFRSGKSGQWQNELTREQALQVVEHHKEAMQYFGYEVDI